MPQTNEKEYSTKPESVYQRRWREKKKEKIAELNRIMDKEIGVDQRQKIIQPQPIKEPEEKPQKPVSRPYGPEEFSSIIQVTSRDFRPEKFDKYTKRLIFQHKHGFHTDQYWLSKNPTFDFSECPLCCGEFMDELETEVPTIESAQATAQQIIDQFKTTTPCPNCGFKPCQCPQPQQPQQN